MTTSQPQPSARFIYSGRHIYPRDNAVYDLLTYFEPGLVLDVGAAAGGMSSRIVQRSPQSRVVAFEPFPGNWAMLDEAVAQLQQVTVDHRAASDRNGPGRLYVSAVVAGDEPGWESRVGYSSAGTLVEEADARFEGAIDVETVRLDSIFDEAVRFLKIDVQGAELSVLTGAEGLLARGLVDLMWVEFTGELAILDYVRSHDFEVFDSPYLLIPRANPPDPATWIVDRTKNLSNGKTAYVAWPREYPRSDSEYCDWFGVQRRHHIIQTDLTFVRRDVLPRYLRAAASALEDF